MKIATIYTYGANEEEIDGILAEENLKPEETEKFIEKIQALFERYFGL